jgi:hypothetical protein
MDKAVEAQKERIFSGSKTPSFTNVLLFFFSFISSPYFFHTESILSLGISEFRITLALKRAYNIMFLS